MRAGSATSRLARWRAPEDRYADALWRARVLARGVQGGRHEISRTLSQRTPRLRGVAPTSWAPGPIRQIVSNHARVLGRGANHGVLHNDGIVTNFNDTAIFAVRHVKYGRRVR